MGQLQICDWQHNLTMYFLLKFHSSVKLFLGLFMRSCCLSKVTTAVFCFSKKKKKNSPYSWGSLHSFVCTLCRDDCPLAALSGTDGTVELPSYLTRTAFLTGQPADLFPTSDKHMRLNWMNADSYMPLFGNQHNWTIIWN